MGKRLRRFTDVDPGTCRRGARWFGDHCAARLASGGARGDRRVSARFRRVDPARVRHCASSQAVRAVQPYIFAHVRNCTFDDPDAPHVYRTTARVGNLQPLDRRRCDAQRRDAICGGAEGLLSKLSLAIAFKNSRHHRLRERKSAGLATDATKHTRRRIVCRLRGARVVAKKLVRVVLLGTTRIFYSH